jgi:hypothetical protein
MMMIWVTDGENYLTAESNRDKLNIKLNVKDLISNEVHLDKESVEELLKLCEIHLEKLSKV